MASDPSCKPATKALPFVLQATQVTPSALMVFDVPSAIFAMMSLPESLTTAKKCDKSVVGFGRSARTATRSVSICISGSFFPLSTMVGSKTANPPWPSADITRKSPSTENATWRNLGTDNVTSGVKVETTSPSPAFSSYALRTFSVDVTTSTFGPAAASRPGFEAMERRLAHAGGTSLVGHGSGRILTFFGPAPP